MTTRSRLAALTLALTLMGLQTVVTAQGDDAAASDDAAQPAAAAFVTGTIDVENEATLTPPVDTMVDGYLQGRGWELEGATIEMDDPRLSGTVTRMLNANVWQGDDFLFVRNDRVRMENDEGAWSGVSTTYSASGPGVMGAARDVDTIIATGEGAYEGLTAYLVIDGGVVEGLVFPGEMPPLPDPIEPAAE